MSNPFCYVELHTDALQPSASFYKKVFDWKPKEVPGMGGYQMFQPKSGVGGGLGPKHDPGAPNGWIAYVEVADVKRTMAKAVAAGGNAVLPYMDLGTGMGAIGVFVDPFGAVLGVWAKPKAAPKPPQKAAKKAAPKKAAKKAAPKKAAKAASRKAAKKR